MVSKIRIKFGEVEVEYEGSEEFIKKELPALINGVAKLHVGSGDSDFDSSAGRKATAGGGQAPKGAKISINTLASRLKANSCRKLMRAAAGYLVLVKGKEPFSRDELYKTMQAATMYKKSYTNVLSNDVKRMIRGDELIENSTDRFSISDKIKTVVQPVIG